MFTLLARNARFGHNGRRLAGARVRSPTTAQFLVVSLCLMFGVLRWELL